MAGRGRELLEHGLRDIYDAEHRFANAMEKMVEQVSEDALSESFRRHLRVTKEQIRRLDRAFEELGMQPSREDCPGSKGLIAEYDRFVKEEKPNAATLDAFATEAGQKVEHYEMVAYRSLITLARFLGFDECARVFRQNLAEEEQAGAELHAASERLLAKLTGAEAPAVMRRAAGTVMDQMREGALLTAGTARTVGELATRKTGEAIRKAERRGRKAVRSAQARGRAKAKPTRRPAASRTRKTSRKPARKTTARTTSRRSPTSRPRSATARKTTARASTRTRTGARRPSRGSTTRARSARTRARSR